MPKVNHLSVSEGLRLLAEYPYPSEGPYCHKEVRGTRPFKFVYTCGRAEHDASTPHVAYAPGLIVIATWMDDRK